MCTLVPPKLLLLDEHTAALDPATSEKIMAITNEIVFVLRHPGDVLSVDGNGTGIWEKIAADDIE